jgi:hypothetical protein
MPLASGPETQGPVFPSCFFVVIPEICLGSEGKEGLGGI